MPVDGVRRFPVPAAVRCPGGPSHPSSPNRPRTLPRFGLAVVLLALLGLAATVPPVFAAPAPPRAEKVVRNSAGNEVRVYVSAAGRRQGAAKGGSSTFTGDTFSFSHSLGAVVDGILKCIETHQSGMGDNTVLFDGLSELLDPYLDGTQPLIFEFESPNSSDPDQTDVFMNGFGDGDLFPEGFEDPDTGAPLDVACLEIGVDDLLDPTGPVEVTSAVFEASDSNGQVIPPIDLTDILPVPFDGRVSVGFSNAVGQGIDGVVLEMTVEPFENPIFADGFESGNTSSWQ